MDSKSTSTCQDQLMLFSDGEAFEDLSYVKTELNSIFT